MACPQDQGDQPGPVLQVLLNLVDRQGDHLADLLADLLEGPVDSGGRREDRRQTLLLTTKGHQTSSRWP